MAYEFERDEWRSAVRALTEVQRLINTNATRAALGVVGDPTDALSDDSDDFDGDDAA